METPEKIEYRVKELRSEMEKKGNARRVISLASTLHDTVLELHGRIARGRRVCEDTPSHRPYLQALEVARFDAEEVLRKIEKMEDLTVIAARVIFDAKEIPNEPSHREGPPGVQQPATGRRKHVPSFAGYKG